jgi:hypothetical protein
MSQRCTGGLYSVMAVAGEQPNTVAVTLND